MILVQWTDRDARAIGDVTTAPSFRLPSGHFQPLLPPETLDTHCAKTSQRARYEAGSVNLAIPLPAESGSPTVSRPCVAPPRRQVASSPGDVSSAADLEHDTRDVHSPRVADEHAART